MKLQRLVLISLLLFVLAQIFSLGFSSASDGNNEIGFPFIFYEYLGGKRFPEPDTRHHFILLAFLVDIIISFLMPLTFFVVMEKKQTKKE